MSIAIGTGLTFGRGVILYSPLNVVISAPIQSSDVYCESPTIVTGSVTWLGHSITTVNIYDGNPDTGGLLVGSGTPLELSTVGISCVFTKAGFTQIWIGLIDDLLSVETVNTNRTINCILDNIALINSLNPELFYYSDNWIQESNLISQWTDLSRTGGTSGTVNLDGPLNNNHGLQSLNTDQPIVSSMGGNTCPEFTTSDDSDGKNLTFDSTFLINSQSATFVILFYRTVATTGTLYSAPVTENTANETRFDFASGGIPYFRLRTNNSLATANFSNVEINKWLLFRVEFDGTGSTNEEKVKIWVNGVPQILTFSGTFSNALPTNSGIGRLGRLNHINNPLRGYVLAAGIWSKAISKTPGDDVLLERCINRLIT